MGLLGRKLTRRFWPGPVTLLFERSDDAAQNGLASALPASVSRELYAANGLALRLPAHELTWSVLRLLPSPLVATGENHGADHHAVENQTGENRMGGTCYATAAALAAAAGDALDMVVDVGAPRYDLPTTLVRVGHDRWEVVSEGVASRRTLNRLAGNMYLFVCTGNTCRSPMAEGLFRKLLSEKLKCPEDELVDRGYMVVSAGVAAAPGQPPSPEGVEILGERGVDLRGHESQPVTPQLLSQADHIFTMTRSHRDLLVREFPDTASSVRLLARNGSDVIDPIGSGMEEYRRCADQIETELQRIVTELPTGS